MIDIHYEYAPSNYNFKYLKHHKLSRNLIQKLEHDINRINNVLKIFNIIKKKQISIDIEKSIFEYSILYCLKYSYGYNYIRSIYDDKFYEILINIDDSSYVNNKTLKNDILTNIIHPIDIAFLPNYIIHPKQYDVYIRKKNYQEWKQNNIDCDDNYECEICGGKKSKTSQQQTRSSDEPMTIFITCLTCKNTIRLD